MAAVFSHNGWLYNCENKSLIGSAVASTKAPTLSSSKYHLENLFSPLSQSDSNRSPINVQYIKRETSQLFCYGQREKSLGPTPAESLFEKESQSGGTIQ